MAQPDTQHKRASAHPPAGSVEPLPQTIFISEKRGAEPAPPPRP